MNARILRKWSVHTKNLMSCSVCSLVVVVLLLLVTCAPPLILATMNFRSDASFAANPPHMPKNLINKEATLPLPSALASTSAPVSASSSASSTLLASLASRNHRLASTSGVEVVKSADTRRESFPDYYKNYPADDSQPSPALQQADYISSGSSGSNGNSGSSKSRQKFIENKQLGYMIQLRGWPRHYTPALHHPPTSDDVSFNHGIKQSYTDKTDNVSDAADREISYGRNVNGLSQTATNSMGSYLTTSNRNFPVQQHFYTSNRRIQDRIHHVAPSPLSPHTTTSTKALLQLQRTSRTASVVSVATAAAAASSSSSTPPSASGHLKEPELIHNNINNLRSIKNFFSKTHNKSVVPEQVPVELPLPVPVPVAKEDNVFGIDNKIKSSAGLPLRLIIESYEVPASLPLTKELTEQQRRMLIHEQHLRQLRTMQQQAARSRRDSLRGRYKKYQNGLLAASSSSSSSSSQQSSPLAATSFRKSPSLHNLRQHPHQHQHLHQNHERMRKHSRRYCSARDPAQLAFEAPTVFEGKIVSMTPDRRQNFSATVEVREVFKQQIGYRLQKYLRLQFAYRNNSGECDIYREELRPRGLVRGDAIEPGRLYMLFVQQIDIGNFTILGQPIRKTKRVVEAVRYAVSGNYAQLASIKSISASNRSVENGQELRIVCKVTGRPPPKVTWFKDHRSINRNRKLYQFSHYKKRSELIIRSFNTSDAGRYECRAKNKVNRNIERRAIVIKAYPVQRFDPNPRGTGNSCPDDASEFCFNGGTCKFFSEIGSYSCICPEGFIGERCDRKEVNNMPPSTYSNEHECGENKYLGSYYC